MVRLIPALSACVAVLLTTVLWGAEPKAKAAFTYRVTKKTWKLNDKPVLLCDEKQGFAIFSGFGGEIMGYEDYVQVRIDEQRNWYLLGKAREEVLLDHAQALVIDRMTPRLFAPEPEVFEWKVGQKPVKMIAADQGVCYLSMVTGFFNDADDGVWIEKRDDGFYWLNGKTNDMDDPEIGVQAIALKFNRSQGKKVAVSQHRWSNGSDPLEIFPKTSGLCFITGVRGDISDERIKVMLDINAQDNWMLSGQLKSRDLAIEAVGLRWDDK